MMQVQILHKPFPGAPAYLAEMLHKDIKVGWGEPESDERAFEVLVVGRPSRELLHQSSSLQSLVIPFAGIPAETRELLLADFPSLPVYNLHHNAIATAEMAMALLFSVAKNLIPADRSLRNHDWRIRYAPNQNLILRGSSVLVLGYGAVGKEIANLCRASDMEVHAVNRKGISSSIVSGVHLHTLDALDSLLSQTDILFIALPLTPQTEGLMDSDRLAKLHAQSLLINVARGAVVDEKALYDALNTRTIGGAGLDVWYSYPTDEASREHTPPANFAFHELENVVMSPHRGGGSRQNEYLRLQHLAELLNMLYAGESPSSRVDVLEGY